MQNIDSPPVGLRFVLAFCVCSFAGMSSSARAASEDRPNILWISTEDISSHLGCYGDVHATTPNLDRLAAQGVRYTHCFGHAGVCAVNRSGIITGMYPTSIGSQHMRCKTVLPPHIRCFTEYLREAGYYCTNNSKTDYNFSHPKSAWGESNSNAHWRKRSKKKQPFFSVFNFSTTHESRIASEDRYRKSISNLEPHQLHDPSKLILPPYYPDTPAVRQDWARYYDIITAMDQQAGEILAQLAEDGLAEETIVFFWSDHGVGLPRAKRWLYDSGSRVPLIVRIPEKFRVGGQGTPGMVNDDLVAFVDFAPTVLNLAGVEIPEHLQGQPFLGPNLPEPRDYVFGARDRMDERYDIIRCVRDQRWRYIRNFEPHKAYYQYMNTPEKGATMRELRRLHADGKLPLAAELFMAQAKPIEELYDTRTDPHEIHNLAESPEHRRRLQQMREILSRWMTDIKDLGLMPEPEIVQRTEQIGHAFGIARQSATTDLIERLVRTARLGEEGIGGIPAMIEALGDRDAAVRYWGAIGLGNLRKEAKSAKESLRESLLDPSPSVRIAAARALCRMGNPKEALLVLKRELASNRRWVRLNAVLVLDEIGDLARPAIEDLRQALRDKKNKYVVRVANHALNELLGTASAVP